MTRLSQKKFDPRDPEAVPVFVKKNKVGIIKDGKYIPDEGKEDTADIVEIKLAVALIKIAG